MSSNLISSDPISSDRAGGRAAYFDKLYRGDPDPWRYHDGPYEIAKRADTLNFLDGHYTRACEVGCSIGVLSAQLATRCDYLLALDISEIAIGIAQRTRLADSPIEFAVMHLPHARPAGTFDLLVLSEVLYFFDAGELVAMCALAADLVMPGGQVLIVSFDGETQTSYDGPAATARFLAAAGDRFDVLRAEQREHYHVRLLRRRYA